MSRSKRRPIPTVKPVQPDIRRPASAIRHLDTPVDHRPPEDTFEIDRRRASARVESPAPPPDPKPRPLPKPQVGPLLPHRQVSPGIKNAELRSKLAQAYEELDRLRQAAQNLTLLVRTRVGDAEVAAAAASVDVLLSPKMKS